LYSLLNNKIITYAIEYAGTIKLLSPLWKASIVETTS
jgi:hypothetical protein